MPKSFNLYLPMRAGILLLTTLLLIACGTTAHSNSYRVSLPPDGFSAAQYMKIKLLGTIALSGNKVNGFPVEELSDLAWDAPSQTLYAVSDSGYLYTLKIKQSNNKLFSAKVTHATRLQGANKKFLRGASNDPEGLALVRRGDKVELIISFEGNSRVERYDTQGKYLRSVRLPKKLNVKKSYQHPNKSLESTIYHPKHGVLTASELPLKASPKDIQTIYSQFGQEWRFKRYNAAKSSITALEVLENGDILVLERAFSGIFKPLIISLRQLKLNQCNKKNYCQTQDIAVFNSAQGWNMDNFEGLTKLSNNRFLMVSDDNQSPLQQTLMVMFEVVL